MSAHASRSPSSADRWTVCTAAPDYEAQFDDTSSTAADEGTFAHDIASRCLTSGKSATTCLGRTSECKRFTVDADMAMHIDVYLDAVRFAADMVGVVHKDIQVEKHVKVNDEIWGTADAWFLSPDGKTIYVFDFKYGQGKWVGAKDNKQLVIYGAGALMGLDPEVSVNVEHIELHIVQPRNGTEHTRHWSLKRDKLESWLRAIVEAEVQTHVNPQFVAGDHCGFCKGRVNCKAHRDMVNGAAAEVFAGRKPPVPAKLTTEEIDNILHLAPQVRAWLAAVEDHAFKQAEVGVKYPRFKMVAKIGLRKWNDEKAAKQLLQGNGCNPHAEPKLVSPAQAEKLLQGQGATKKQAAALIKPLADKPVTGKTLVPASDSRKELPPPKFPSVDDLL